MDKGKELSKNEDYIADEDDRRIYPNCPLPCFLYMCQSSYSVVNKSRPVRLQAVINCHHGTVNLPLNVELTRWRSDRINSDSRSTATVDSECVGAPSLSSPLLFSRALLRLRTLRMYLRRNTTTRSATRSLREFNSDSGTERCRSFKENCH